MLAGVLAAGVVLSRRLVLARRKNRRKALGSRSLRASALCFLISLNDGLVSLQCRRIGGEAALHLLELCTQMLCKVPSHEFFSELVEMAVKGTNLLVYRSDVRSHARLKHSGAQIALLMSRYLCSSLQCGLAELRDHAQILSHLLTDNQEEKDSRIPDLMVCSLLVYLCNK